MPFLITILAGFQRLHPEASLGKYVFEYAGLSPVQT